MAGIIQVIGVFVYNIGVLDRCICSYSARYGHWL